MKILIFYCKIIKMFSCSSGTLHIIIYLIKKVHIALNNTN